MKWSHFDVALPRDVSRMLKVFVALGALTLAAGVFLAPERIWPNFLLVNYYLLGVGLAGLLFVALLYVTTGAWGVAGSAATTWFPTGTVCSPTVRPCSLQ